jgi:hypothetical protein
MSKHHFLLATAAAAALIAATTSASLAFDKVTWDWTSSVNTSFEIDPVIVGPTALTQVEKAQVQIGNVTANATTGTVDGPDVSGSLDDNSPSINTSATAVGNNQNITANTATFLNDGQFTYGSATLPSELETGDLISAADALFSIDNSHLAFGLGVVAGEALNYISPATISASSSTTNVFGTNVNVNNEATAVANNTNVSVDASDPANNLLIGDLTQVAVASVSASAALSGVTTGLGSVNNHATAVGNNVNINVGPIE